MPPFLPLPTQRLALRRFEARDVDRFAAYRADAELARYQGWSPMSAEAAGAFVAEMHAAPALVEGAWFQLAIARRPGGELIGDIGLCLGAGGALEIGFTLERRSHGQGFATEAVGALLQTLLARPEVRRVVGIVDARNQPSIRVLERLGMRLVGREDTVFKGAPCTELRYERSADAGRA